MRDLVIIAVLLGSVPFIVVRPWVGVLAWSLVSLMNPHRLAWGLAYDFPAAQVIALATLLGFVVMVVFRGQTPSLPMERETKLLLVLWGLFTLTSATALHTDWAWPEWGEITKILLMCFVTMLLIDDARKLRYLLLVVAVSLGFFGFKGGLFSLLTGGTYRVWGPEDSFIADNNALALAMNMVLPVLFYLGRLERNRAIRLLFAASFVLTVFAVLFTFSRGGLLGLVMVSALLLWRARMRTKIIVGLVLLIALPTIIGLMPGHWIARMETLKTYDEDNSARSRIEAWKVAWGLALDRPLTGGGFDAIDDPNLYELYNPGSKTSTGVHSVYLEVIGENGFITFGVFVGLLFSTVFSAGRLAKSLKGEPALSSFAAYACIVQVAVSAYAISGAFLELASFDLFYTMIAILVVTKSLARRELSRITAERERAKTAGPTMTLRPASSSA